MSAGLFLLLFIMLATGIPVAFSIGLSSVIYMAVWGGGSLIQLPTKIYASNDSYVLLAIPLFVFAGYLMETGGISRRLVDFVYSVFGRIPGALGSVAIITSMIFAALTGSAIATIAAVGSIMYPLMVKNGYKPEVAAGLICGAGSLGPVIPPSVPMVIYGSTMGVSVADLFLGGIVPGLLIGLAFLIANTLYAVKKKLPVNREALSLKRIIRSFFGSAGVLFLPVLILGGIYGGILTPTEAATLAVIYSLILSALYRTMTVKRFFETGRKAVLTSSVVMVIINVSNLFAYILNVEKIPQAIAAAVLPYMGSKAVYLIMLFVLLAIVGMLMDSGPAILIIAPIIVPIGIELGIDPTFLGVMFCVILCMGVMTPPFGMGLFTIASTSKLSFGQVVRGTLPFAVISFAVSFLLLFLPEVTMALISN